jgi:hypothetical protein
MSSQALLAINAPERRTTARFGRARRTFSLPTSSPTPAIAESLPPALSTRSILLNTSFTIPPGPELSESSRTPPGIGLREYITRDLDIRSHRRVLVWLNSELPRPGVYDL